MYRLKKTFLIIFLFLILPLVAAQVPDTAFYDHTGGQFDIWERGVSFWNAAKSDDCDTTLIDCTAAVLQDRRFIPLVENLNPSTAALGGAAAYFRFDNQSPENATFFVEEISGFNGNCSGIVCPIHTTDGFNNTGLLFDGSDDYVLIENEGVLQNNSLCDNGCSICAWFKPDTSKKHDLLSRWDGAGEDRFWRLHVENSDTPGFSIGDGEGGIKTVFSSDTIPLNQFSLLCGVYEGSNETAGSPKIYVNGELKGTAGNIQINSTAWLDSTEDVYIGKITDAGINYASGVIDDVRAWPRALSAFEVECLYGVCDVSSEIIMFDGQNIEIYHGPPLTPVDAYDVGFNIEFGRISNLVEGDGFNDIMVIGGDELKVVQYDGDTFEEILNFTLPGWVSGTNKGVSCAAGGYCIAVYNRKDTGIVGDGAQNCVKAVSFNIDGIISGETNIECPINNGVTCLPEIINFPVGDFDTDGLTEFGITTLEFNNVLVRFVEINGTGYISDVDTTISGFASTNTGGNDCVTGTNVRGTGTSIVTHDFDGFAGTGTEFAVGYLDDDDEFKLRIYQRDGTLLDTYGAADGRIISNPFLLTLFLSSGSTVCVAGYDGVTDELDVLCGHQIGGDEEIWEYDAAGLWDIAAGTEYEMAVHSLETLTQFPSQNEILTSFGVFSFGPEEFIGDSDLTLLWNMPKQNGAAVSVDVEEIGIEDILLATESRLWYIDDLFINSEAFITNYTINPCVNVPIQLNTSMTVTVSVDDADAEPNDLVQARVFVYYGEANQQGGIWSPLSNHIGGAVFTFPGFAMDEIITNGLIRIEARDDQSPEGFDFETVMFSVSSNGVEFGECITVVDVEPPDVEPEEPISATAPETNNSVSVIFAQINDVTGLGTTLLWLIIMGFVGGVLWIYGPDFADVSHTVSFVGLIEIILLIAGVILGFISVGVLITVIILGIIALGITFRKVFTGA